MRISNELIKMIELEIKDGFISKRKHDTEDLYVLNYTPLAAHAWKWNDATTLCRGLIVDGDYNIVARSYPKFFEISQITDLSIIPSDLSCDIMDKADGFLGVMYFINDVPFIASRGTFGSEMAYEANKMLKGKYSHIKFDSRYSYVFEIIIPNDMLVVNYGGTTYELQLHGIYDNITGEDIRLVDFKDIDYLRKNGLPIIKTYEVSSKYNGFDELREKYPYSVDKEGFVLRFSNGFRIKMKYDEYKQLTYTQTAFGSSKVVDLIIDGSINDLRDSIPANAKDRIESLENKMYTEYERLYSTHLKKYLQFAEFSKKDFALTIGMDKSLDSSILMKMFIGDIDGAKGVISLIWKHVKEFMKKEMKEASDEI